MIADVIRKDNSCEEQKIRLGSCTDFNLHDAFATFVRQNRAQIDIADLQTGLDKLGVYKQQSDVEILVRRQAQGNSCISLNQFCNMILPHDRYHRDRVRYRSTNPGGYVSVQTGNVMAKLLASLIETETE